MQLIWNYSPSKHRSWHSSSSRQIEKSKRQIGQQNSKQNTRWHERAYRTKHYQCSCSSINQWQKVCEGLLQDIFIFVCKAIILQLDNNTNLLRWKRVLSSDCGLCNTNKKTQLHKLNKLLNKQQDSRESSSGLFSIFSSIHWPIVN